MDGASDEDTDYKAQTERKVGVPGSAHGLVGAGKEGNASGAKEPWVRMVEKYRRRPRKRKGNDGRKARGGLRKPSHGQDLCSLTNHLANRRVFRVCTPLLELNARLGRPGGKCPHFQPDWGNLAVRDEGGGRRKRAEAWIETLATPD